MMQRRVANRILNDNDNEREREREREKKKRIWCGYSFEEKSRGKPSHLVNEDNFAACHEVQSSR